MRTRTGGPLALSAALVVALAAGVRTGVMPLGVRGEWEWLRLPVAPAAVEVALAAAGVAAYAAFAGLGFRLLASRATPAREGFALLGLLAASVAVQWAEHSGAPAGYGLAKWVVALHQRGSSGYFTVAREEARDARRFAAEYPAWVARQDALHIGTHPPGLIVAEAALLHAMERSPAAARFVVGQAPDAVAVAFRVYGRDNPLSPADRATLALTGFLTLLACAGTVVPLYLLARGSGLGAPAAWSAAALWPVAPSAVLFQPAADTAFPLLATAALALAAGAARPGGHLRLAPAALAGVALGLGTQFTLAFFAVGLVAGALTFWAPESARRARFARLAATGAGFLGVTAGVWGATGANPFVIWWWNQRNHARFYEQYPRTFAAWAVANPVELAVGIGLPAAVWGVSALARPRGAPRVSLATAAVLAFLTLGGRNLSEVGRLWLPFMPALLVASGAGLARAGAGPKSLAASVALSGLQTLALEATIQVVYPV